MLNRVVEYLAGGFSKMSYILGVPLVSDLTQEDLAKKPSSMWDGYTRDEWEARRYLQYLWEGTPYHKEFEVFINEALERCGKTLEDIETSDAEILTFGFQNTKIEAREYVENLRSGSENQEADLNNLKPLIDSGLVSMAEAGTDKKELRHFEICPRIEQLLSALEKGKINYETRLAVFLHNFGNSLVG